MISAKLIGVVSQSWLTGGPRALAPTFLIASATPSTASRSPLHWNFLIVHEKVGPIDAVEGVALTIRKVGAGIRWSPLTISQPWFKSSLCRLWIYLGNTKLQILLSFYYSLYFCSFLYYKHFLLLQSLFWTDDDTPVRSWSKSWQICKREIDLNFQK